MNLVKLTTSPSAQTEVEILQRYNDRYRTEFRRNPIFCERMRPDGYDSLNHIRLDRSFQLHIIDTIGSMSIKGFLCGDLDLFPDKGLTGKSFVHQVESVVDHKRAKTMELFDLIESKREIILEKEYSLETANELIAAVIDRRDEDRRNIYWQAKAERNRQNDLYHSSILDVGR